MDHNQPDYLKIGASSWLCSVRSLAQNLRRPEEVVKKMLSDLRVPLVRFPEGETDYFNLYTLDLVVFAATEWNAPGWDGEGPLPEGYLEKVFMPGALRERLKGVAQLYQSEHYRSIRQQLHSVAKAILRKTEREAPAGGLTRTPSKRLTQMQEGGPVDEPVPSYFPNRQLRATGGQRGVPLACEKTRRRCLLGTGIGRKQNAPRRGAKERTHLRRSRYNPEETHLWNGGGKPGDMPGPISKGRVIGGPVEPEVPPLEGATPVVENAKIEGETTRE